MSTKNPKILKFSISGKILEKEDSEKDFFLIKISDLEKNWQNILFPFQVFQDFLL